MERIRNAAALWAVLSYSLLILAGCSTHERKEPARADTTITSVPDSIRVQNGGNQLIWAMRPHDYVATGFPSYELALIYAGEGGCVFDQERRLWIDISGKAVKPPFDAFPPRSKKKSEPTPCTCGQTPQGRQAIDVPATPDWDPKFIETAPINWRTLSAKKPPEGFHRADFAYDAGGIRDRGESDGRFRIQDLQVVHEPAGPFGGAIADTLLIVDPDPTAPAIPGRFTIVDSIFEVYKGDQVGENSFAFGRTDTTLLVRPH